MPRRVPEIAHQFNGFRRSVPADTPLPRLSILSFDLKDFFTKVPRSRIRDDVQNTVVDLLHANPRWRYF